MPGADAACGFRFFSETCIDPNLYGQSRCCLSWFRVDLKHLEHLEGNGVEQAIRDVVVCNSPR